MLSQPDTRRLDLGVQAEDFEAHFTAPSGLLVAAELQCGVEDVIAGDPTVPACSCAAIRCALLRSLVQIPEPRPNIVSLAAGMPIDEHRRAVNSLTRGSRERSAVALKSSLPARCARAIVVGAMA